MHMVHSEILLTFWVFQYIWVISVNINLARNKYPKFVILWKV